MDYNEERGTLIKNVIKMGIKFPSRQRFSLKLEDGKLGILSIANESKIKLENEKFVNNRVVFFSGEPTALLDIVECQNAEEYVDHLLSFRKKWKINNSEEESK